MRLCGIRRTEPSPAALTALVGQGRRDAVIRPADRVMAHPGAAALRRDLSTCLRS